MDVGRPIGFALVALGVGLLAAIGALLLALLIKVLRWLVREVQTAAIRSRRPVNRTPSSARRRPESTTSDEAGANTASPTMVSKEMPTDHAPGQSKAGGA